MRYIRQKPYSNACGPVAIINALKWAGYSATNECLPWVSTRAWCYGGGTTNTDFNRVIRSFDHLQVLPGKSPFYAPPIDLIDYCLASGGAFAIGYTYKRNGKVISRHFSLCVARRGKSYVFVNDAPRKYKKTVHNVRRSTLVKMLKFRDEYGGKAAVWFLDRR